MTIGEWGGDLGYWRRVGKRRRVREGRSDSGNWRRVSKGRSDLGNWRRVSKRRSALGNWSRVGKRGSYFDGEGLSADDGVESVQRISSVFDDALGAIGFHEGVGSLDCVSGAGFLLALRVSGQRVLDVIGEAVLWVGVVISIDGLDEGGGDFGDWGRVGEGGSDFSYWSRIGQLGVVSE